MKNFFFKLNPKKFKNKPLIFSNKKEIIKRSFNVKIKINYYQTLMPYLLIY